MIGFYVIMISVLALSGAVGYTILSSVQTTNALSLAERNAARLELSASALRQVISVDGSGRLLAPMGAPSDSGDATSRTALPSWVSSESVTPWGVKYGYCPYATETGSGDAETVYGGPAYSVSVTSGAEDPVVYGAARDYVVAGMRPANLLDVGSAPDVLAFLISPSNNLSDVPSCDDVYWDGRAWLVSGAVTGSVRAVTLDAMADTLSLAPRQLRRHVREGGSGSGLSDGDPASLDMALREWASLRPHRMTLVLQDSGGDISVDPVTIDFGEGAGADHTGSATFARHLILEAAVGDSPKIDGAGLLTFPSDLTINGVDFGSDIGVSATSGTRLLAENTALSSVSTGGGDVVLGDGVSITAPVGAIVPPLRVVGGGLSVEGSVVIDATEVSAGAIRQEGGQVHVSGSLTVTTTSPAPLFEDGGFGEVSGAGTLTLNGAGTLSAYVEREIGSEACATGTSCQDTCATGRALISGYCSAGASSMVLSETSVTCTWAATNLTPSATAICAPQR